MICAVSPRQTESGMAITVGVVGAGFTTIGIAVGLGMLLFAALVFAGTLLAAKGALKGGFALNQGFLTWSSIVGYFASLVLVYLVTMLDMLHPAHDILDLRERQEQQLTQEFRRQRGGSHEQ